MLTSRKHKDIDLLKAYTTKSEPSKAVKMLKYLLPPLLVTLVFVTIFATNKLYVHNVNSEIDTMNEEITQYNNKITVLGTQDYDALVKIQEQKEKIETVISTLMTYPKLTSNLMNVFTNNLVNGMSIQTITFEDGVIKVDLQSSSVLNIELYVRAIRASGNFAKVDYVGYTAQESTSTSVSEKDNEQTKTAITTYAFQITCTAKGAN